MHAKDIGKIVGFLACAAVIIVCLSSLFTPVFDSVNGKNSATIRGMYHQPRNSVQVAFVGTSSVLVGASPVQLYEETGLVSYNCGTRAQPLIVSYYLLRELHRLNPDSLKVVVLDPGKVVDPSEESSRAKQSFLLMNMSPLKLEALWASSQYYEDFDFLENLVPILGYHSRWNSLTKTEYDMFALGDAALDFSSHGYLARYGSTMSPEKLTKWLSRNDVTDTQDFSDEELETSYDRGREYLDLIVEYCKDNDLDLVFVKLPRLKWSDLSHDAITRLADGYGVDLIDMNSRAVLDEINLDFKTEMIDHAHANVSGSVKFTHFIAEHLGARFAQDVGDGTVAAPTSTPSEAVTQGDIDARTRELEDSELFACGDLFSYLDLLKRKRYVAFLATQGTDVQLDEQAKEALKGLGLNTLADLDPGKYYTGIVQGGKGVRGLASADSEETVFTGSFDGRTLTIGLREMQQDARLDDKFRLVAGDEAIISALGADECVKRDGLNVVVYDTETRELIDSGCFSLSAPYARIPSEIAGIEVV